MWRRNRSSARLRSAARRVHRALFPALDFVFPARCFACGAPLGLRQHLGACAGCWSRLAPLRPPLCLRCGLPAPTGSDLHGPARGLCGRCLVSTSSLDGVCAAMVYDDVARKFLLRAKLGRRRELLLPLALRLAAAVRAGRFQKGCDLLVPVPSHPLTDLWRGFSPSLELARHLSRVLRIRLSTRMLRRRFGPGGVTKRLSAARRRSSTARELRLGAVPRGRRVLLADDVMTTGATAEACASLLRSAGSVEVRLAVLARRPTE